MRKKYFIAIIIFLICLYAYSVEKYTLGGIAVDPYVSKNTIIRNEIEKLNPIKTAVMITDGIPPVGNQGGLASCTCWAIGYYYKTFMEWKEHGWDVNDSTHMFSPAFMYAQLNGGANYGSIVQDAFLLLEKYGVCSMKDMPYDDSDYLTYPEASDYYNAAFYKTSASYYTPFGDLTPLKQHLSNGDIAVFHIACYLNFWYIDGNNPFYSVADQSGSNYGGHAVVIIGYDDSITTPDGKGAFRCINSWGTDWGERGYWWITYQAIKYTPYVAIQGFWYAGDRVDYDPKVFASFNVSHDKRDIASIGFFRNTSSDPQDAVLINDWIMDSYRASLPVYYPDEYPFPSNDIVYDLSDIVFNNPDSVFLAMEDTMTDSVFGAINSFKIFTKYGDEFTSPDPKVDLEDEDFNFASVELNTSGGTAVLSSNPDSLVFDFSKNDEADTASFCILNTDAASGASGIIYSCYMKNSSFWIEQISIENDTITIGDSIRVSVQVDTSWLGLDETYSDTLLVFMNADSLAKGILLNVPIFLKMGLTGITANQKLNISDNLNLSYNSHQNVLSVSAKKDINCTIDCFDLSGRKIDNIYSGNLKSGFHKFSINPSLKQRVFFIRSSTGDIIKGIRFDFSDF